MTHVAAHDDIRAAGRGQRQIFVIIRIDALLDCLGWLNAWVRSPRVAMHVRDGY